MILLNEQKILFLKPHKVAGTSFEIALSKYAGTNDIITGIHRDDDVLRKSLGFRSRQNVDYTPREILSAHKFEYLKRKARRKNLRKFQNHISAKNAQEKLGSETWDKVLKVSMVRNPFDCVVSNYYWKTRNSKNPPEFAKWFHKSLHLVDQNYEQYFINGSGAIDYYIRFENLEQDIRALEQSVVSLAGLYDTFASINAKGNIRPARSSASDFFKGHEEIVDIITDMNQRIIEKFDYSL
ncbi:sulfotransferase family 2 domain-containing protein [Cycloclasticus sp.]|uniref:sulfotransferase family 2 domain-containing protein n=1 Tax=Cycloclasticus sp. TaxID=2024830 RepID=UPI000C0F3B2B|nr:sulfotransferase family 2 domain-containing protein [Cycloclasticus sp.]PHR46875.1 MAG: hypothetical protein COA48_11660 [Cycloclasticus sp.]